VAHYAMPLMRIRVRITLTLG